ncbi:MAG: 4Fe-4S cluster-binding domain-containing protein [Candidatus Omnitrophota bacterium]|nr:4Fe-4S cluster-binding domain-containing protein [Candidatus Omnitrophota bacterium]
MTDKEIRKLMECCTVCPRNCRVSRNKNELGFCKAGDKAEVYSAHLHSGEEPPISGRNGSGTIFFAHCNLRCVYCQNYKLSQMSHGKDFEADELSALMLSLESEKAHNINLVTPTHYAPQIAAAVSNARKSGLRIPVVYNTSGYEALKTLQFLEGLVDIYLVDMRYGDNKHASKYSACSDYVEINQAAVTEMYRQVGNLKTARGGIGQKGVIIRHLVLPHNISGTDVVLRFISEELGADAYVSFMSQYYPAYDAPKYRELSRRINRREYDEALSLLEKYGLHNGWVQEHMSGSADADFAGTNITPDV